MILDKTAILQIKTTTFDSEGMEIDIWTANNTYFQVNIQDNNSSQMLIKDYSNSTANSEYIIFAAVNTTISEGQKIVYGSNTYEIMKVKKWQNHYELICSPV